MSPHKTIKMVAVIDKYLSQTIRIVVF